MSDGQVSGDELGDAVRELEAAERGVTTARNQLVAAQANLHDQIAILNQKYIETGERHLPALAARRLYWEHPLVPSKVIGIGLGVHGCEVHLVVGPLDVSFPCDSCGAAVRLRVRSRTQLKELESRQGRGPRSESETPNWRSMCEWLQGILCLTCREDYGQRLEAEIAPRRREYERRQRADAEAYQRRIAALRQSNYWITANGDALLFGEPVDNCSCGRAFHQGSIDWDQWLTGEGIFYYCENDDANCQDASYVPELVAFVPPQEDVLGDAPLVDLGSGSANAT